MMKKSEENKKRKRNEEDEIGAYSNVYSLNEQNAGKENIHVTFYSDNCCGQNKNKFITALYSYAVSHFTNIESITHKFLIKGHTQNEGDNVHSLIEKEIKRNKKAGPIYAPCQYVTLIKNAKKNGKPFTVKELTYDFFIDIKNLQEKWGYNFNEDEDKNTISFNDIKILNFRKSEPFAFYFKTSYTQTEYRKCNSKHRNHLYFAFSHGIYGLHEEALVCLVAMLLFATGYNFVNLMALVHL
ncbi:unnamed protein product [Colias eurytheme]|nr:unnamed protein product [Colias eurytheme]